jgi:hypothetical protein
MKKQEFNGYVGEVAGRDIYHHVQHTGRLDADRLTIEVPLSEACPIRSTASNLKTPSRWGKKTLIAGALATTLTGAYLGYQAGSFKYAWQDARTQSKVCMHGGGTYSIGSIIAIAAALNMECVAGVQDGTPGWRMMNELPPKFRLSVGRV